jgi:hypothetical protein
MKAPDKITWKDIQDILAIDEVIMLERFSKTGRIRAFSQRHCRQVLREFKKSKED